MSAMEVDDEVPMSEQNVADNQAVPPRSQEDKNDSLMTQSAVDEVPVSF